MLKEKLSRPLDIFTTFFISYLLGLVTTLLIPQMDSFSSSLRLLLNTIPYLVMVSSLSVLARKHLGIDIGKIFSNKTDYRVFLKFFFIYFALLGIFTLFKFCIFPSRFEKAPDYSFFPLILPVLLFTGIQTFYEELSFRALLYNAFERESINAEKALAPVLVSALFFAVFHLGNAGLTAKAFLFYALLGAGLMYTGLLTGGFESSFAIHFANNLFIDLIICVKSSPLIKNPLFLYTGSETDLLITETVFTLTITVLSARRINNGKKTGPEKKEKH